MSYDIGTHLDRIVTTLGQAFPDVATIEEYPRFRKKITAPAIFVEFADADQTEDAGTEQLCMMARFEARVVFDRAMPLDKKPSVMALSLASAVAKEISANRFGCTVGPAKDIKLEPDHFKPELGGYVVWLIEWTHSVRIGDSVWDGTGITPTDLYVGIAPEIGLEHEDDYTLAGEIENG